MLLKFLNQQNYQKPLSQLAINLAELSEAVKSTCDKLVSLPPNSLRISKKFLKSEIKEGMRERMKEEGDMLWKLLNSDEAKDAFANFLNKKSA